MYGFECFGIAYPQVPLLPTDPYSRAQVRYTVDSVTKSVLPPFYRLLQAQEEDKRDEARQGVSDLYKGLQKFTEGITGPFWAGEQFTHADIALLPFIVRLPILETHRSFKRTEVGHGFEGRHTQLADGANTYLTHVWGLRQRMRNVL
ncbi:hypothetical protein AG1IA_08195 [Rhizoctonia solani AG-1 IA]|uniref:GST C-terminal domain-containing protein n=1 Tax=Thanatephorus cucumeris (strain AG1-IA) TaxID=983506 RepID=L8WN63_THACA|nr:hypothetical protein AG1IA_08195 [Rhizoctonia solani AG-1 IA]